MWIYIHIKDSFFCGFGAYIWIFRVQIFMRRRNRRWGWLSPSTFSIILILHTYTYGKQRKERKSWKWKSGQSLIFWEKKQTRNISHDIFVCMIYVDVHWRACMDGFYSLSLHDRQLCSSNNEICNGWLSPCSTTDMARAVCNPTNISGISNIHVVSGAQKLYWKMNRAQKRKLLLSLIWRNKNHHHNNNLQ